MTSLSQFNAFAALRGEGLHPRLRDLLERSAAFPFLDIAIRHDGLLQAGPAPKAEMLQSLGAPVSFPHEGAAASAQRAATVEPDFVNSARPERQSFDRRTTGKT
jgi:hypothetical protein